VLEFRISDYGTIAPTLKISREDVLLLAELAYLDLSEGEIES